MSERQEYTMEKKGARHEKEPTLDARIKDTLNRLCAKPAINVAPLCSGDGYPVP